MLRFAPTPDGDMNINDLRIALLNYIVAKQKGEEFIIRIEDLEKEKTIEGKDQEILDLLALFGIEYSQIIHQSQNFRFYSAMALQLLHEKKAFSCFCSDEWLNAKRKEAEDKNEQYRYDDACRNLPPELVIDNTNPFTIRINKPDTDTSIDSFVIMNRDKTPTFDFASAVDDMLSDISFVVRDEKYKKNTLKQKHIRESLKYEKEIEYIHIPTVLSKENTDDASISIKWLLKEGFVPEAILDYLISITFASDCKIFNIEDAIKCFKIENISDSPESFDLDALRIVNKKHLENMDSLELSRYVGFADANIGELAKIYLQEASTTKELKSKIEPVFASKSIPDEIFDISQNIKKAILDAEFFDEYSDFKKHILEKTKLDENDFVKALRCLLTGSLEGPDIELIYKYIKNYIGEIVK